MLNFTPDEVAVQIGPIAVYWYGILYAVGLAAVYLLLTRLAVRAGRNPDHVGNGMIIVAIAAVIGGRLYHVIDQWALYQDNPASIFLPFTTEGGFRWTGVAGLGVYGGIATGTLAAYLYTRRLREPFWAWADIIAPGLFLMQAIGRWGNFFNQELFGPPTNLPWGIPIDCDHRLGTPYPCATFAETTTFHPLFLYESLSGLLGMIFLLWLGNRFRSRLRPGDLALAFFIWYGTVRFALETLRSDNWTFFGVPTAMLISAVVVIGATAVLVYRHRGPAPPEDRPEASAAADPDEDGPIDELPPGADARDLAASTEGTEPPTGASGDATALSDGAATAAPAAGEPADSGTARPAADPDPSSAG